MSSRWILIIFIGICSVLCSAEKNFEVTIDRAEISDIDPEMTRTTLTVHKYNRTCKVLSVNFTLLKNMSDMKVEIQGFALYSNEYRPVPVRLKCNICDLLKNEYLWVKSEMEKTCNIPTQCPVLAGDYYIKDYVPNGAGFPAAANFPWTKVMLCLRSFYRDQVFSTIKLYLTLDHDAELKRMG